MTHVIPYTRGKGNNVWLAAHKYAYTRIRHTRTHTNAPLIIYSIVCSLAWRPSKNVQRCGIPLFFSCKQDYSVCEDLLTLRKVLGPQFQASNGQLGIHGSAIHTKRLFATRTSFLDTPRWATLFATRERQREKIITSQIEEHTLNTDTIRGGRESEWESERVSEREIQGEGERGREIGRDIEREGENSTTRIHCRPEVRRTSNWRINEHALLIVNRVRVFHQKQNSLNSLTIFARPFSFITSKRSHDVQWRHRFRARTRVGKNTQVWKKRRHERGNGRRARTWTAQRTRQNSCARMELAMEREKKGGRERERER